MADDLRRWLEKLDLAKYAETLAEHEVLRSTPCKLCAIYSAPNTLAPIYAASTDCLSFLIHYKSYAPLSSSS